MTEQWQELKETITELRDNDGTGTQQEVCKFLANLMDVLEKQMQEPCDAVSREAAVNACLNGWNKDYKEIVADIRALPSVQPKQMTGRWSHDGSHWKNRWICSECGYKLIDEQTRYCPNCGRKMEEVEDT